MQCVQSDHLIERIRCDRIQCVLEFENSFYLMIKDVPWKCVLQKCRWNYYQGFQPIEEEIPPNVLAFAQKILELHLVDETHYPLDGEWYSVRIHSNADTFGWSLKKNRTGKRTTAITAISFLLHFIIAVAFTGLMMLLFEQEAQEWLHALLPSLSRATLQTLVATVEFSGSLLLFLLFWDARGFFDLYLNTFVPFSIIVAAGAFSCYWWMWIAIPIGLGFSFLLSFFIIQGLVDASNQRYGKYVRCTLIVFAVAFMITVSFSELQAYSHTSQASEISNITVEEAENQHQKNCRQLEQEKWTVLTVQEKLDLLQAICDYECQYVLGCKQVKLYAGLTGGEKVLGKYSNQTASVTISEDHLKNSHAEDVLRTALHEIRHAYQHTLTEMYFSLEPYIKEEYKNLPLFEQVQSFSKELDDYCSGEKDFDQYYAQEVEKDSRDWAATRIKEYYAMFIYPNSK